MLLPPGESIVTVSKKVLGVKSVTGARVCDTCEKMAGRDGMSNGFLKAFMPPNCYANKRYSGVLTCAQWRPTKEEG